MADHISTVALVKRVTLVNHHFGSMSLLPTETIFTTVTSTKCLYSSLQFMAEGEGIVASEEIDTCEVGFTKKTYLAIFLEGHSYFGHHPFHLQQLSDLSNRQLDTIYMATISILTTTNEYNTVWRLHEEVVTEMYCRNGQNVVVNDLKYCLALATSRLARVNKSSSLWLWLRKLAIMVVFHWKSMTPMQLIRHILRSMELHLANYCASFTLMWLVDVASALGVDVLGTAGLLRRSCRGNLGDVSLWKTLHHILQGKNNRYSLVHYSQLCYHLQTVMRWGVPSEFNFSPKESVASQGIISQTEFLDVGIEPSDLSDLQWLLAVECTVHTPYFCVVTEENKVSAQQLIRKKIEEVCHKEIKKKFLDCLLSVESKIRQIQ